MKFLDGSLPAQALFWGATAGAALLFGVFIGYYMRMPRTVSSAIMAFGVGVLVSALSFNLMTAAFAAGGISAAVIGFLAGATVYSVANAALVEKGAGKRKMSNHPMPAGLGPSIAIALGSLLDGIPEAAAIGTSLLGGSGVAVVTVVAICISNIPEGLSSAVGMRESGKSATYVFSIWVAIAVACALSSWLGYVYIGKLGPFYIGAAQASAAGAIFVMLIDTMIPEAFDKIRLHSGTVAAAGFLLAFVLDHMV